MAQVHELNTVLTQVPGSDGMGFAGSGFTRRRSLDDPTSNTIGNVSLT